MSNSNHKKYNVTVSPEELHNILSDHFNISKVNTFKVHFNCVVDKGLPAERTVAGYYYSSCDGVSEITITKMIYHNPMP